MEEIVDFQRTRGMDCIACSESLVRGTLALRRNDARSGG